MAYHRPSGCPLGYCGLWGKKKVLFADFCLFVPFFFFFDLQPDGSRTKSLPWAA